MLLQYCTCFYVIINFRDTEFNPTPGWWYGFKRQHSDHLAVRTPSLIDPGKAAMSKGLVFDHFFEDVRSFYSEISFDGTARDRIYNIDESWFNPADEKRQKVVVDRSCKVPYKIYGGVQEHITLTMCASADGKWMPPMFTFKTSLPTSDDYHTLGPQNALFNTSESGHINTEVYRDYLMHLEPHLNPVRPVVILQDNLKCHEDYDLCMFRAEKGIHLFNFPKKVSHIIQPLDKLFGPLKQKF